MRKYILIVALLLAATAQAHTGGYTYEVTKDNFFVDIGANKTPLTAGEMILFEYNLYPTSDPNNLAGFDNVYVTIANERGVVFSSYIHRPEGSLTVLSYDFQEAGRYTMSARFQKGREAMTEVEFPLDVQGRGLDRDSVKIAAFVAVLGMAVGYGLSRMLNRGHQAPTNS